MYKSSAGSGKTFALVKAYLVLCLNQKGAFGFSKILAITFTNKAAQEMKDRILKALKEMAGEDEDTSPLKQAIQEELKLSEEELQFRSRQILTAILHHYADFNVSTIDTFSHRLVRTFARDLGLNLNFKVDLEEDMLLQEVVDQLISQVGKQSDITKILVNQAMQSVDQGKTWNPAPSLFDMAKQILKEDSEQKLKSLKALNASEALQIQQDLNRSVKVFEGQLEKIGQKALDLMSSRQVDAAQFRFGNSGGLPSYFKKLSQLDFKGLEAKKRAIESIESDKWYAGNISAEAQMAIDEMKPDLTTCFNEAESLLEKELPLYFSRKLIAQSLGLLALLKEIETHFANLKVEKGIVPISDFNKRISEVVMNEPMPFIYERLGEKFDHIMIDEFQDTSVMQFMNLMPLIEEALSRGKFNLIVGDAKQAIYRFRGGHVEQFAEMPDYLPEQLKENAFVMSRMQTLRSQYAEEILPFNYRSAKEIVEFNNAFFENIKAHLPDKIRTIFHAHQQKLNDAQRSAYVEIKVMDAKEAEERLHQHHETTLERIKRCLEDGFNYGDIAILCRTRHQATSMAEFLKTQKIPIVSSESLLIAQAREVKLLLSVADYHLDPKTDKHVKAAIENYVLLYGHSEDLHDEFLKMNHEDFDLETYFNASGHQINLKQLNALGPYDYFEELIRQFELVQPYNIYIQFFMEHCFQFQQNHSVSIEDFLNWWKEHEDRLSIEMSAHLNRVQILTIHKSKGLEFPVVIYPFAKQSISSGRNDYLWLDGHAAQVQLEHVIAPYGSQMERSTYAKVYQEEKERRIMDLLNDTYVAFTRAVERLIVLTEKASRDLKPETLPNLIALGRPEFAEDIESGYAYGSLTGREKEDAIEQPDSQTVTYRSTSWRHKIRLAEINGEENQDEQFSALRFGNLFHEIMAQVNTSEDLDFALNQAIAKGKIDAAEKAELQQRILTMIKHPQLKALFSRQVSHCERTMYTKDAEVLRPDRVVEMHESIAVLDYKTGHAKHEDRMQMAAYRNIISDLYEKPVNGLIYYVNSNEVVEC